MGIQEVYVSFYRSTCLLYILRRRCVANNKMVSPPCMYLSAETHRPRGPVEQFLLQKMETMQPHAMRNAVYGTRVIEKDETE